MMTQNTPIILASQSPRRRQLLQEAGLTFTVSPSSIDESLIPVTAPQNYVKYLAEAKAGEIADRYPDQCVIGADTIVLQNSQILNKPVSRDDARLMLNQLSGRTHRVLTGFCIMHRNKRIQYGQVVTTDVRFKQLTPAEIEWYIHTDEPYDKAGAYAIQGTGASLVEAVYGSYTNVVGLPVCEVIQFLLDTDIIARQYP